MWPQPALFKTFLSFTNESSLSLSLLFLKSKSLTLKIPSRSPLLASQADQRMAFLASPLILGKLRWINNLCGWKPKISRGSCNSAKTPSSSHFFNKRPQMTKVTANFRFSLRIAFSLVKSMQFTMTCVHQANNWLPCAPVKDTVDEQIYMLHS